MVIHREETVVTVVKVITENFLPEVCKMLPKVKDQGQHFTNRGQKIFTDD